MANWFVRRRADLYGNDISKGTEKTLWNEDGLYGFTVNDLTEDEQVIVSVSAQRLR